jgi:hypothetical protein
MLGAQAANIALALPTAANFNISRRDILRNIFFSSI